MKRFVAPGVAVAVALAPLTLAFGGAASAGGNYRLLMTSTAGGSAPIRWNPCQDNITYKVNTMQARESGRGKAAARATARSEVVAAMDKLGDASGLTFTYTGATSQIPTGADWWQRQDENSEIVIAYVGGAADSSLLSTGSWGEGGQVYKFDGGSVVTGRGFAVFDRDKARRLTPGFGRGATRGNLVLHELGHVVGLDHVSDPKQLMNPTITARSPNGFASGDRAGLAALGPRAGCIDAAPALWSGS